MADPSRLDLMAGKSYRFEKDAFGHTTMHEYDPYSARPRQKRTMFRRLVLLAVQTVMSIGLAAIYGFCAMIALGVLMAVAGNDDVNQGFYIGVGVIVGTISLIVLMRGTWEEFRRLYR